jgi:DNA repair protein RecO (recombination protein O)
MRTSRIYVAEGIILKRRSVGEADRMITIFTKQYGKIRVLAKGVRRIKSRRAGHLEVFSHVICTIHNGRLCDMLSEANSVRNGALFDTDAVRLEYAYSVCELVDRLLADRQEHVDIFFLLRYTLNKLLSSDNQVEYRKILLDFVHTSLWNLGFLPKQHILPDYRLKAYVEGITENRLRAWPLPEYM